MSSVIETSPASSKLVWAGRILSGVTIAFLLFDGVIHLTKVAPVVQAFAQLGFPVRLALGLGILEIVCVALYGYPRTAILGGICLAGYLGGAVAMQLRVGNPLFGETLFPEGSLRANHDCARCSPCRKHGAVRRPGKCFGPPV